MRRGRSLVGTRDGFVDHLLAARLVAPHVAGDVEEIRRGSGVSGRCAQRRDEVRGGRVGIVVVRHGDLRQAVQHLDVLRRQLAGARVCGLGVGVVGRDQRGAAQADQHADVIAAQLQRLLELGVSPVDVVPGEQRCGQLTDPLHPGRLLALGGGEGVDLDELVALVARQVGALAVQLGAHVRRARRADQARGGVDLRPGAGGVGVVGERFGEVEVGERIVGAQPGGPAALGHRLGEEAVPVERAAEDGVGAAAVAPERHRAARLDERRAELAGVGEEERMRGVRGRVVGDGGEASRVRLLRLPVLVGEEHHRHRHQHRDQQRAMEHHRRGSAREIQGATQGRTGRGPPPAASAPRWRKRSPAAPSRTTPAGRSRVTRFGWDSAARGPGKGGNRREAYAPKPKDNVKFDQRALASTRRASATTASAVWAPL